MTKTPNKEMIEELRKIRRDLMEKNNPTIFQKMRQAVERIKLNEPTADDYRLVMQWPAIAAMFFKSSIQKK